MSSGRPSWLSSRARPSARRASARGSSTCSRTRRCWCCPSSSTPASTTLDGRPSASRRRWSAFPLWGEECC
eukprot:7986199-Pyramimonas_sp.AAC.1